MTPRGDGGVAARGRDRRTVRMGQSPCAAREAAGMAELFPPWTWLRGGGDGRRRGRGRGAPERSPSWHGRRGPPLWARPRGWCRGCCADVDAVVDAAGRGEATAAVDEAVGTTRWSPPWTAVGSGDRRRWTWRPRGGAAGGAEPPSAHRRCWTSRRSRARVSRVRLQWDRLGHRVPWWENLRCPHVAGGGSPVSRAAVGGSLASRATGGGSPGSRAA